MTAAGVPEGAGPFRHDFPLDRFQQEAVDAIEARRTVLVAAPTGAGKTVVAEAAVAKAIRDGGRAFYTTPIKALSNQKFGDLGRALGVEQVGLLTGDHSINADAPVVVMTTEVLRNMVYAGSDALDDLQWVVLDEVHFLQDAYRGPVWEEVLIHLPGHIRFVCLSATVSNIDELGEWIEGLRGPTTVVVEHQRPVDLHPLLMVSDKAAEVDHLLPLVVDGQPNPEGHRFDVDRSRGRGSGGGGRPPRQRNRFATPRRIETIERLDDEALLPAIYFIFSRKGCDEAARACVDAGMRLTSAPERDRIRELVERRCSTLPDADLDALGYDTWLHRLQCGFAAHHAGMVPAFREAVEDCFAAGLIKVVFATETLALGINMPARSVVIERLTKYTGDGHDFLSAGQFTQLTGRAGRRGIDEVGYAVVLYSPFIAFDQVATLAASREFPLTSSFRPTYNMTANLVRRYSRDVAEEVLGRSFAQFQADRAISKARLRLDRQRELLARLDEEAACKEGDVTEYLGYVERVRSLRRQARGANKAEVVASLVHLRPGDVIAVPGRSGTSYLAVLSFAQRKSDSVRLSTVDAEGRTRTLDATDFAEVVQPVTRLDLPVPYQPKDRRFIAETARLLRRANTKRHRARSGARTEDPVRRELEELRVLVESHPVHRSPNRDRHIAAARRAERIRRETRDLRRTLRRSGNSLPGRFEAVVEVLAERGYIVGWELTERGDRLRRIFHEADLLISLALEHGLFDELDPAELTAFTSCFTYEHRSSEPAVAPRYPTPRLRERVQRLENISRDLNRAERARGISPTRGAEPGFVPAAFGWAAGGELDDVLDEDLSGGDFVRNVKLLIDLLRQIAQVTTVAETRRSARTAADRLHRGVVALSGAVEAEDAGPELDGAEEVPSDPVADVDPGDPRPEAVGP